jgi:ATP-binding cassette, subfamily B, bacterial
MTPESEIKQKIKTALRLDRALRLVWNAAPGPALLNAFLVVIQGALPLAILYLMKMTVDAVSAGVGAVDAAGAFQEVLFWIALTAGAALAAAGCKAVSEWASEAQAQRLTDSISDILHAQSVAVDLGYYEDSRYYDTLHLAQQQAPYRPAAIVSDLLLIGQSVVALSGIVALLFALDPIIGLMLFAVAFPGSVVRLVYARRLYAFEEKQTESERRAWSYHWALTAPGHAKEIRLFDLGLLFRARFAGIRKALREGRLSLASRRAVFDLATQAVAVIAVFGTFAYICYRTMEGTVSVGELVMYYLAFQSGLAFLQSLLRGLTGIYEGNLFLSGLYQFMDIKPGIRAPENPHPMPAKIEKGIRFEDVSFSYPGRTDLSLANIDIAIGPGQVIALVGENGSGKTTLLKLLCRLYDPDEGRITIDGIDIRMMDPVSLRKQIGGIFQDYVRYDLSARENIWLGDISLPPQSEKVPAAAALTGADRLIGRLPGGYDTVLGPLFAGGRELSLGEWQKVALARALLRDAHIIALDEPTSFLDAQAEAELFANLDNIKKGRSVILVSHRFSAVRPADCIYVLENGRVSESGSHKELMERNGRYASLFNLQS